jgi:hypothetical protein
MSAYEAIHSPYDWNHFPLAPSGCNAVIYEAPESQGSWASHSTNAWYVGPLQDHYRCSHFFVPYTQAYKVSGSTELFPQHCQAPYLVWNKHLQEVIDKIVTMIHKLLPEKCLRIMSCATAEFSALYESIEQCSLAYPGHEWLLLQADVRLALYMTPPKQRVDQSLKQRVDTNFHTFQRIIGAPSIMNAQNPTHKCSLNLTKRMHQ